VLVGLSVFFVLSVTKEGTWPRRAGLCVCAVAVFALVRAESATKRKLGWTAVALALALVGASDGLHGRAADLVLYVPVGCASRGGFPAPRGFQAKAASGVITQCEHGSVPSGAVARVAPVLFVCDSIAQ
jgi:hypothetical protein